MVVPILQKVTDNLIKRSAKTRQRYLDNIHRQQQGGKSARTALGCTNIAHAFAAMPTDFKIAIQVERQPNIGIISAYNDMLSAHQPFLRFPQIIKDAVRQVNATAQFAGATPAMCDGVTQGYDGMELSLFSRDVIAMSTAIALAHHTFDGVICLGVCDKIVPGLLMGALSFGHLPVIFAPAGPMTSGISNDEKAKVRQLFAEGKVGREALLESETKSYHSAGTCTFYGTANSNQMLMEFMGLHLPGAAFCNPNTPLRDALTARAAQQVVALARQKTSFLAEILSEKTIINGVIGLLATGGSTNHTMHLVAIARCAGIDLRWEDFDALSGIIPLLCRVYPNGKADVNHFHAAGSLALVMRELLNAGLLHEDVKTVIGSGLSHYCQEPFLQDKQLTWRNAPAYSLDSDIIRPASDPFSADGGLKLLRGNLGKAVIKVSAVPPEKRVIRAPAIVFTEQQQFLDAFKNGELARDFVAVVRFQGPRANGMPELHQLTPQLGVLQERGFQVALLTDGRMSGASGKTPAAIHCSPEALMGGNIGKIQTGDMILIDANRGVLEVQLSEPELQARAPAVPDLAHHHIGTGRELFAGMRAGAGAAEAGAMSFRHPLWDEECL